MTICNSRITTRPCLYGFCHLASAGDIASNAEQCSLSQQYHSSDSVSVVVVNSEELVYDALN
jgi:hypothetical protein